MFNAQLKQLEGTIQARICSPIRMSSNLMSPAFSLPVTPGHRIDRRPSTSCGPCLCSMIAWVNLLQRMDELSDLKAALTATIDPKELSHTYVFNIRAANLTGPFSKLSSRFEVGTGICSHCSAEGRCYVAKATAKRMLKNYRLSQASSMKTLMEKQWLKLETSRQR